MRPDRSSSSPLECDVAIVGGGLAGHCAALAAVEAGASVVMVEKQPAIGGSTVLSGGFFALANTPLQRAAGIADDATRLYRDLAEIGGPDVRPDLLAAYCEGQADLSDWLTARGAAFTAVELSAGQSVPRSHRCDVVALVETLAARLAAARGCTVLSDTAARRLVVEAVDGPVTGLLADGPDGPVAVRARGGVVLASGGFSRSPEMIRLFAPGQQGALLVGGAGNVGDGLRMACKLGAGLRDMGEIRGTFGTHPTTGTDKHMILLAFYLGAVIVNADGRRFVDESASYKQLGDACLREPGRIAWQVFDAGVMRKSEPGVPLFDLEPSLASGLLLQAETLDELAVKCGMPAAALAETIARYNAGVAAGRDPDFGRDGLCHHAGAMLPIAEAPFYAYPSTTVVLATYCGLDVDAEARVHDVFGDPIAGLFAAGEIMGGFHGRSYMTGSSLGKAAFFGRVAGGNAARRASLAAAA
jgi:fumarate reductase flavoprotein subunit